MTTPSPAPLPVVESTTLAATGALWVDARLIDGRAAHVVPAGKEGRS